MEQKIAPQIEEETMQLHVIKRNSTNPLTRYTFADGFLSSFIIVANQTTSLATAALPSPFINHWLAVLQLHDTNYRITTNRTSEGNMCSSFLVVTKGNITETEQTIIN